MSKPEACLGCPAYLEPGPVWGSGNNMTPRVIMCGEAPGDQECATGEGFVGTAGNLLWMLSRQVGVTRDETWVTNIAKCKTKHLGAFAHCYKAHTQRELEQIPGVPIVALGDIAKKFLIPNWDHISIMNFRGSRVGRTLAAIHPAWARRSLQRGSEGAGDGGDKQDLSPTIAFDVYGAVAHYPPEHINYIRGIPESILDEPGDWAACDLETIGQLDPRNGGIGEIGWCMRPGIAYRENYDPSKRELYAKVFKKYPKQVFHNMNFDVDWLEYNKYEIQDPHCTMILAHLANPDLPLGLEFQNSLWCHYPPWKGLRKSDPHKYHATDLDTTNQIYPRLIDAVERQGLLGLYNTEVLPATKVCLKMKQGGMRIDFNKMLLLNRSFVNMIEKIDGALNKFSPIDWGSPKQVMGVLYDGLKLPVQHSKTTGNPTSDADALETLWHMSKHPLLKLLLQRRAYEKMRSTYSDYKVDSQSFFHDDVSFTAATGRARGFLLTLQKGAMRSLFVPDQEGWEMAYADWNRVELWISAILSGDRKLQEVLARENFHVYVGRQIPGHESFTKESDKTFYEGIKHTSHGINFGRGAPSIAEEHEMDLGLVNQIIAGLKHTFPQWFFWREQEYMTASKTGQLMNPFGFIRHFWSGNIRGMAYSFQPQSVPAHMIKRCIVQLDAQLPKPARLLLPVHDATLVCYPTEIRKEVHECLHDVMEQAWPQLGGWKATISIGVGKNFQEASENG